MRLSYLQPSVEMLRPQSRPNATCTHTRIREPENWPTAFVAYMPIPTARFIMASGMKACSLSTPKAAPFHISNPIASHRAILSEGMSSATCTPGQITNSGSAPGKGSSCMTQKAIASPSIGKTTPGRASGTASTTSTRPKGHGQLPKGKAC